MRTASRQFERVLARPASKIDNFFVFAEVQPRQNMNNRLRAVSAESVVELGSQSAMSVAVLQRSISGDRNAHKHTHSGGFCIVITVFDQTTVVLLGCYVFRFVTEILDRLGARFLWAKRLCATLGGCIA